MPVSGIRPAAIRASSSRWLSVADELRGALALGLERGDVRAELRDLVAELVLLALELRGGLDERRPLLGRVPDARPLRRELGGDQEAEGEEREPERDLPARDRPQSAGELGHGWGWSGGRVSGDSAGAGAGGGGGGAGRAHGSSGGGASAEGSAGRVHGTDPGGSRRRRP